MNKKSSFKAGEKDNITILGRDHVNEFFNYPKNILSRQNAKMDMDCSSIIVGEMAIKSRYDKYIGFLIFSQEMDFFISKEHKQYLRCVHPALKMYSMDIEYGQLQTTELKKFLHAVMFENAVYRVFGKGLSKSPKFLSYLKSLMLIPTNGSKQNIKQIQKLKNEVYEDMVNIVYNEFYRRAKYRPPKRRADMIQLILNNFKSFDIKNKKLIFGVLLMIFIRMVKTNTKYLEYVIIDIAMRRHVYVELAKEQKKLVLEHGNNIDLSVIKKMDILDSVIKESIRLASPSCFSVKRVEKRIFLSNGTEVGPNEYIGFDLNSYNKKPNIFGNNPYDFDHTRHLKSGWKLSRIAPDNLMWGLGMSMCPIHEYATASYKMFLATLIRGYRISSTEKKHPGYNLLERTCEFSVDFLPHNIAF
ncbi:hypothetical protein BB558_004421 [Smittium angustum]|uniref:Cytochrome P450 n=1 Tax=Smittium angustum TaxID=133377 RepID=A0A2U1J3C2_SMIAN|nr:hypothetical protein BB558_004421 [Smittium angustum]